jgi:hypothetical protein
MAYPQDLTGRYLGWKLDLGGGGPARNPVTNVVNNASVTVDAPVFTNPNGTGRQAPWSFRFLKYVQGETTVCQLGNGVLTGPLSGCWIFRYNCNGPMVSHVGTVSAGSSASLDAKRRWVAYANQNNATQIWGVRTSDITKLTLDIASRAHLLMQNPVVAPDIMKMYVCLYFDAASAYMLVMAPLKNRPQCAQVLKVRQATPQPWASVKMLREFQEVA